MARRGDTSVAPLRVHLFYGQAVREGDFLFDELHGDTANRDIVTSLKHFRS